MQPGITPGLELQTPQSGLGDQTGGPPSPEEVVHEGATFPCINRLVHREGAAEKQVRIRPSLPRAEGCPQGPA